MSIADLDALANDFGGPAIPEQDTADPRYPFLFLIDVSGSTSVAGPGDTPDIVKIKAALDSIYAQLRAPAQSDPLALTNHQVDVAIVAYSTHAKLLQKWTAAPDLPASAPSLAAGGGTCTGKAIIAGLDVVLARQKLYKAQNLPRCGVPHIFHLTDGEANDVQIDDNEWQLIKQRIASFMPAPDAQRLVLQHFVAPNGYKTTGYGMRDAYGNPLTGAALLERWFGAETVSPLGEGADNFQRFAKMIVRTITAVSAQAAVNREHLAGFGANLAAEANA